MLPSARGRGGEQRREVHLGPSDGVGAASDAARPAPRPSVRALPRDGIRTKTRRRVRLGTARARTPPGDARGLLGRRDVGRGCGAARGGGGAPGPTRAGRGVGGRSAGPEEGGARDSRGLGEAPKAE